jgi:peptide/nickel transport system substrate-binding protein
MKKWFIGLAVSIALILIIVGCSQKSTDQNVQQNQPQPTAAENKTDAAEPRAGGEIIFGAITETPSLDPFLEASDERTKRTVLMYEGLTWVNDNMEIEPRLAEKWDISEDGKEYTFYLRKEVYFHDGSKMTAEDVKYSYDILRDPNFGSNGAGDFGLVEDIVVVDENTVKFILKEPFSTLLAAVGGRYGGVVPKGTYDSGDLRNRVLGTGPYMLADWKPKNKMELKKFDKYWNKDVGLVDKITIRIVPDENSLVSGLKSGQIDMAILGDPKDYFVLKDDPKLEVIRKPALRWATFELMSDVEPTNDVRVRQAIAKAIDKNEIMEAVTGGVGTVIGVMPSSFGKWVVPVDQLPNQQRDVEGAKKLLAEAGYANGFSLPIRIIDKFPWMRPAAEVVASNLSDVGISVKIDTVDLGVWQKDWREYTTPNTFNEWGGFTDPDLLYYRHFHNRPKGGDWRRWNSEAASALLDQGRAESDQNKRLEIYKEFQQLMAEEVPSIPLFSPDSVVVMQKNVVSGYNHHPSDWWYGLLFTTVNK